MKWERAVLAVMLLAPTVAAEELLKSYEWTHSETGEVISANQETPFSQLKVEQAEAGPSSVRILTIESPPIASSRYALVGEVRYEGVEGRGYLEMWNVFAETRSFSRTLADAGPLESLSGSAGWRRFVLPFFNLEGGPPPIRLEVNVVLPGRGTVYLGPLQLVQYGPGENPLAVSGQWWTDQQAGLIGGSLGTFLGCVGGLIGWLGGKGRARMLVLGLMWFVILFGLALLGIGLAALGLSQPPTVYAPLLLVGLLCVVIMGVNVRPLERRYREAELRRMRALDTP